MISNQDHKRGRGANGAPSPPARRAARRDPSQSVGKYSDQVEPLPRAHFSSTMVQCPICDKQVVTALINQHIDTGCQEPLLADTAPAPSKSPVSPFFQPPRRVSEPKRDAPPEPASIAQNGAKRKA